MAEEILFEFEKTVTGSDGATYRARACGHERDDGKWEAWLEFVSVDGAVVRRTGRETTQPRRSDIVYWTTGISPVFLEGALGRSTERTPPPSPVPLEAEPILDPFSTFARGEEFLRWKLAALDVWHLRTIAQAHGIVRRSTPVERIAKSDLVELIVAHVRGSETTATE